MAAKIEWTEEMITIAVGMKRAGLSAKAIAKRLGVPERTINSRMQRMKVRKTPGGSPHARPLVSRILDGCTYPILEED
jgi:transposase